MDKNKWKSPSKESLKSAYENRGKYVDKDNRRYIFNSSIANKVWKVEDKSHKTRLLPVHPDDNINFYGMTVHIHTNVGVNGDQFLCLKRMKNMNCPICEQQASLWDSEPEMAKDLYPTTRYLVWVIDLSLPENDQEAKIWSCPRTAMDDILGVSYKKSTDEILNLANIEDGLAIYFDREKTQGTNFSKYKNFQLDDSPTVAKDKWLEGIISFTDVLDYASYEEIKNAFLGIAEEVSPKESVSPSVETTTRSETVKTEEKSIAPEVSSATTIVDMDRDQLEAFAGEILGEDFEANEIEEMGTKKLKRLIKEALEKKPIVVKEEIKEESEPEDPKEALKRKLRERVNS